MAALPVTEIPARSALLSWLRHNAPDLRIGRAVLDGTRWAFVRFTWLGHEFELEASGDDADEKVVVQAANAMRETLRLPPLGGPPPRERAEREIVMAAMSGRQDQADALARQLVEQNATAPRGLYGRTQFGRGKTW